MSKDKLQFLSPLFLKYQADFEKNPRSRVFAPLAESYRKVGMLDKAMDILAQGIRFNPGYTMGYLGLGFCYFDLKQYNLAYSTLRPLIESNRDNLRMQRLFADVCLQLLRKEEALETYKYLLFVNPKDKEVAGIVANLEKELDELYRPIHNPIIIPDDNLRTTDNETLKGIFNVDRLNSAPTAQFDDWLHVDLNANNKKEDEDDLLGWNIKKMNSDVAPNPLVVETNSPEIHLSLGEEKAEETVEENAPIVTHTLVDLYCGQGHIEKAIEILEKILILNPSDSRTKEKLKEIKSLVQFADTELEFEREDDLSLLEEEIQFTVNEKALVEVEKESKVPAALMNVEELISISEEQGRQNLMSILDEKVLSKPLPQIKIESKIDKLALTEKDKKSINDSSREKILRIEHKLNTFLKKIRERALDYQNTL